jgi:hypothetical protein
VSFIPSQRTERCVAVFEAYISQIHPSQILHQLKLYHPLRRPPILNLWPDRRIRVLPKTYTLAHAVRLAQRARAYLRTQISHYFERPCDAGVCADVGLTAESDVVGPYGYLALHISRRRGEERLTKKDISDSGAGLGCAASRYVGSSVVEPEGKVSVCCWGTSHCHIHSGPLVLRTDPKDCR